MHLSAYPKLWQHQHKRWKLAQGRKLSWALTSTTDQAWLVNVRLQGIEIMLKMDTGAEVTVISEKVYDMLEKTRLGKPSKVLY